MFSIAIVIFREIFEISLIVGILVAATKGLSKRSQWVWTGIFLGIAGSILIAIFADAISQAASGLGQEILNASILIIAAILIGWTVIWMNTHGKQLSQELKEVGSAILKKQKPMYTLGLVVALAVLREGAEIVMFTYSAFITGTAIHHLIFGGLLGLFAGVSIGMVIYFGLMKIPIKRIFSVTSGLLILLVAGMVSQAFGYLTAANMVPELVPMVWDTSGIVSEGSFLGKLMHVLMGYTERPSGIQLLTFLITIGGLGVGLKLCNSSNVVSNSKKVLSIIIGCLMIVGLSTPVYATKKVYSPIVEEGELEIEARVSYDVDERSSKDNVQKHKYAIGYGFTDRWFSEIYGEVERAKNDNDEDLDFNFTALAWENRFQLTEQGQWPVDVGLYLEYETSFENKHADKLEGKLLLEKSLPNFTHTLNLSLEQQVGRHPAEDLAGGFAWSSKYRLKEYFQPGLEWHSDLGELGQTVSFHDQKHQLGPVFYGKVGQIKYDIGYLFGMSDAVAKGELKWVMEYELKF